MITPLCYQSGPGSFPGLRPESPLWIGTAAAVGSMVTRYVAAIPLYGRTLASDLLYAGALFGLPAWLSRTAARSERVPA